MTSGFGSFRTLPIAVFGVCAFVVLQCSPSLKVDRPSFTDDERHIMRLINGGRLGEAASLIDTCIHQSPADPKYALMKATHLWYSRYLSGPDANRDSLKALLAAQCEFLITLAETQPASTVSYFYLGSAYSYLSRVDVMNQDLFSAFFHARKGSHHLKNVLDMDPLFVDAGLNIGVVRYFAATRLNGWQSALASLAGMGGQREDALALLDRTAAEGDFNRDEARLILAVIYNSVENNDSLAWQYIQPYYDMYPENNLIGQQYRTLAFSRLIMDHGTEYLETHADSLMRSFGITHPALLNSLGYRFCCTESVGRCVGGFQAQHGIVSARGQRVRQLCRSSHAERPHPGSRAILYHRTGKDLNGFEHIRRFPSNSERRH